ncbi:hypothetical protein RO3G_11604 [Rhizopus delemar RA 99-880]|uniref:Uncharacterized protein n=1 Tax=Rhizopus delemar (strain RA 99-880 / ATCC MYA-4621 / FGSC 9543 / NRRL 43880) TaxID=246409 RepID=I1CEL3_RHIO9|nr:hypothetical protein RO3G_11604 [Rhizopus delemar RA 99-880]|eukprot:EIE86893.1 hypothetical protein RO3G_11604 [Rhizopus delemar RA 99-880]
MFSSKLRKYIVCMVAFKVELIAYNLNEDAYKHSSISSFTDECRQVLYSKKIMAISKRLNLGTTAIHQHGAY